jgi:hypothetical protein
MAYRPKPYLDDVEIDPPYVPMKPVAEYTVKIRIAKIEKAKPDVRHLDADDFEFL